MINDLKLNALKCKSNEWSFVRCVCIVLTLVRSGWELVNLNSIAREIEVFPLNQNPYE